MDYLFHSDLDSFTTWSNAVGTEEIVLPEVINNTRIALLKKEKNPSMKGTLITNDLELIVIMTSELINKL